MIMSTPTSRGQFARFVPPGNLDNLSGPYESLDGTFDFFRVKKRYDFDSSSSEDEHDAGECLIASEVSKPVSTFVYIDDFNAVEALNLRDAPAHYTTSKAQIHVTAKKYERLFNRINNLAEDIGMVVNGKKTQMLCVNACKHNNVSSVIRSEELEIKSGNSLKLLGFTFDSRPNANRHVESLIEKFYTRLWTLRFLKRSGLSTSRLLEIYNTVLRSAVEYCSTVYHSLIPQTLSNKLEGIQRQALRIIYGCLLYTSPSPRDS